MDKPYKRKVYTIVVQEHETGFGISRTNDGFTAIELLGVLEMARSEILDQMRGIIKPSVIKRKVIIPKKE